MFIGKPELMKYQYYGTKFAFEGWHDCLKQETSHLHLKSIISELGFFRTKIINPENIKFRSNSMQIIMICRT
jgi:hypothetical protein